MGSSVYIVLIVVESIVLLLNLGLVGYSIWDLCHFDRLDKPHKIVIAPKKKGKKILDEIESEYGGSNYYILENRYKNLQNEYKSKSLRDEYMITGLNTRIKQEECIKNEWFIKAMENQTQIDMLQEEVKELNAKLLEYKEKVNDN